MRALVLAAGLGTRLKPLTDWLPKPLVPVGDRPALSHATDALRAAGATKIVVNTFALGDALRAHALANGLDVSAEETLLGTAGGLGRVRTRYGDGDWIVWNGDVVLPSFDPSILLVPSEAAAVLVVRRKSLGEGNVGIDATGRVTRLRRETTASGEAWGGEFLGVHRVGGELAMPMTGCLVGDVYLPALRRGASIAVVEYDGAFHDVGTLAAYMDANESWLRSRGASSFVAQGAFLAQGASVRGSVVGAGARVFADVESSVVWPGATVDVPMSHVVVTPRGVVSVPR